MRERLRRVSAALDRPALGLVMQLAALYALPAPLSLAGVILAEDLQEPPALGIAFLQLLAVALQLATGIAIARRSRFRLLLAAYGIATTGLAIALTFLVGTEDGDPVWVAMAMLETFSGPLVLLIAPLALPLDRLGERRSAADVAAVMFVLALSAVISVLVGLIGELRMLAATRFISDAWISRIIPWTTGLVIAAVMFHAARRLMRPGAPAAARRALGLYLVVSIVVCVTFDGIAVVLLATGAAGQIRMLPLMSPVIEIAVGVARPLVLWAYVRPLLREPIAVERRALAAPLVWAALWMVPLLLTRWPAILQVGQVSGSAIAVELVVLLGVQAVAIVVAVRTALRSDGRAYLAAVAATVVAVAIQIALLVWLYALFDRDALDTFRTSLDVPMWPLAVVIATLATLAWSQRIVPPDLPTQYPPSDRRRA